MSNIVCVFILSDLFVLSIFFQILFSWKGSISYSVRLDNLAFVI